MEIKARLIIPDTKTLMKQVGLDEGGRVQKYIDNFVKEESRDYIPKKTRTLADSSSIATKNGSGLVIWNTPYANYMYEGKLMVDPITLKGAFFNPNYGYWSRPKTEKILDPSGRKLNYSNGGDHWFDKMIDDKMDDLVKGIQNIVGGK